MVVVPTVNVLPLAGPLVCKRLAPEQLSLTDGLVQLTTASQPEMLDGQPLITGSSSSVTVTVWVHVEVFPAASVAVHVTVVVPTGYVAGASLLTVTAPVQLSEVVGVPNTTAEEEH